MGHSKQQALRPRALEALRKSHCCECDVASLCDTWFLSRTPLPASQGLTNLASACQGFQCISVLGVSLLNQAFSENSPVGTYRATFLLMRPMCVCRDVRRHVMSMHPLPRPLSFRRLRQRSSALRAAAKLRPVHFPQRGLGPTQTGSDLAHHVLTLSCRLRFSPS